MNSSRHMSGDEDVRPVDYDKIYKLVEDFKSTFEHQLFLEKQIHFAENQIAELQKGISSLQSSLHQEREHCLQLSIQNEILREELIKLAKTTSDASFSDIKDKFPFTWTKKTLDQYVQWKHVEQQLKLAQDQLATSVEECRTIKQEAESRYSRRSAKVSSLLDRLTRSQELLYETTKDNLNLKKVLYSEERLPTSNVPSQAKVYQRNDIVNKNNKTCEKEQRIRQEIALLQKEIEELKESAVVQNDQQYLKKLQTEQEMLKQSIKEVKSIRPLCEKLEWKHKNEIEGLKANMKEMKLQVTSLESMLSKTVRQLTEDEKDLKYLEAVHASSSQMKQIADEIRRMKLKLALLESNLKLS